MEHGGSAKRHAAAPAALPVEFQLLCLCCHPRPSPAQVERMRGLVTPQFDWQAFERLVERHRVAGLAFHALKSAGISPDRPVASALAMAALRIRQDNQQSAAETVRLQARLDAAGIDARFFKGAALAQLAYGALDRKHSKDIDILVAPRDAAALVALLEEDGYRLWLPAQRLDPAHWPGLLRFGKEVAMIRPGTRLQVEPHWRLAENPHLLADLDATAPAQSVPLAGLGAVRTFERRDMFAYLCVHGIEHGWFRLKWLADLHALIAEAEGSELVELYRHAERRGAGPSAAIALALCERLLDLAIPAPLSARLRDSASLRLQQLSLDGMLDPSPDFRWRRNAERSLRIAWAQGHLASQVGLLWATATDVVSWPLPPALHWLYPLIRIPMGIRRRMLRKRGKDFYPLPTGEPVLTAPSST